MAKKRKQKVTRKFADCSPDALRELKKFAYQVGIRVVDARGVTDETLDDAMSICVEFANSLLEHMQHSSIPGGIAHDQVTSPETGVALWLEWSAKRAKKVMDSEPEPSISEEELDKLLKALYQFYLKQDQMGMAAIMQILNGHGYDIALASDGKSYVAVPLD